MKIGVSLLNFRPGLIGGAETYVRQLAAHMPDVAAGHELVLIANRDNAESIVSPGWKRFVVDSSTLQITCMRLAEAFTLWRARGIERDIESLGLDAILFPQQSIFPKATAVPSVMTVVDVQHLFFPQYFSLAERAFRAAAYPAGLRRAGHVIAISEYTRQTLIGRCGVNPAKVTAVPFGAETVDISHVEPTTNITGPYLYYPAATFSHKKHETLLRTFAALKNRGDFPYKLVLTGMRTKRWPALCAEARELGIADDVIHPGFVPFAEVQRIYRGAAAIVFPSEFEGFGLPVVEAVEFGKKVITSRLAVFDEIGVPKEFQIDFANPDELAAALAS
ncbi:MAG: glycosyltransferase family 1 protein, partial [Planctomycetaceae bacterium]